MQPNFILLYVESARQSTQFYTHLLGRQPVEASSNFAMFALDSGVMLGLWSRHEAAPSPQQAGGGSELAFAVEGKSHVDQIHADWLARGISVLQAPVAMDFGYTFCGEDPDGHRLRVFAPSA